MSELPALAVGARAATDNDQSLIEELRSIAYTEALPQRGGELLLEFDRIADDPEHQPEPPYLVVVGTLNDVVVGYATLRRRSAGTVHAGVIEELFVHPDARMVGVAAAMLAECIASAESVGCTHIESEVLPGNRAAKNFFERMGMVTRKMRVSTPLG